jgi:prepilin-type processing-associated H-X9-DG protein
MSEHSGDGVNVAYCDGRAKFINSSISSAIWRAMGARSGNETVSGE